MRKRAGVSVVVAAVAIVGRVTLAAATPPPGTPAAGTEVFYIPSASMVPTLEPGDWVLVNTLAYLSTPVRIGDIVVFRRPPADTTLGIDDLIKRVVALPGQTISVSGCKLFVNAKEEDQSYLPKGWQDPSSEYCTVWTTNLPNPYRVPADDYFVLGDNRKDSYDSRYWGPLPSSYIVGKAVSVAVWKALS
jgi:signal peptidase I